MSWPASRTPEVTSTEAKPPGILWLLRPKLRSKINRTKTDEGRLFKWGLMGFVGLFFWTFIFAVIYRMLLYFRGTQGIGDLLAAKLLGLALLTFLMILLLSNVITSLSTFFLAKDMELLAASPVDSVKLYGARLVETMVNSSWMVALMVIPLVAAYGVIYGGGWQFYLLAVATMIPYLVMPAVIGTAFTLVLVNVFPARRTRDLFALIGLFSAAGVVVLFRFLRPERLVRPEEFRDLVDFMAVLRAPTSPWLPNEWAANALMTHLNGIFDWFPFLFLWSTAAALFVIGAWLHTRYFHGGFTRAQEGAEKREGRIRSVVIDRMLRNSTPAKRELIGKEIRVFFRDTTQWSQLILLAVLVVVYVYNIKVLPLYTGEQVSFFLINVVSFLNLGLAGFVVAAIAARFVFPAMSLEGRMMWLLKSSPLDTRTLFWAKYWVGTVPLLLVALPLIVLTNVILEASTLILTITTIAMIGITFAITAMALGFGALYPNFETENAAEIPTSFGGLMFMMAAVSYLGVVVILLAWPVYQFVSSRFQGGAASSSLPLLLGVSGAVIVTVVATVLPLRAGVRKVRALEL
jgi:ABC-2 type transport system permease protein